MNLMQGSERNVRSWRGMRRGKVQMASSVRPKVAMLTSGKDCFQRSSREERWSAAQPDSSGADSPVIAKIRARAPPTSLGPAWKVRAMQEGIQALIENNRLRLIPTYGLDGKLIGVPGHQGFYHEQLDRSQWGLVCAGKVTSYRGFVFATMDPEAPELEEFLGPTGRFGIDMLALRGTLKAANGVEKNANRRNLKVACNNMQGMYLAHGSHASAYRAGFRTPPIDLRGKTAQRSR